MVLVETVGVGQDELEVTRTAHTTLVVMAPGMGDDVQATKAGILECADAFAVNKADREGADLVVRDLELMIALGNDSFRALSKTRGHAPVAAPSPPPDSERWTPPIVTCVATRGEGIAGLASALDRHRAWSIGTEAGRGQRRTRLAEEMRESLREALIDAAVQGLESRIETALRDVEARAVDPYTATERLVADFAEMSSAKTH
jgi:LAO/AO transport system kinase